MSQKPYNAYSNNPLIHRDRRLGQSSSHWVREFAADDMSVLIVCRGPIRKEALDVFREMGIAHAGVLLSEKDSIVYTNALAPELRRIRPEQIVSDGNGGQRISSAAFDNSSNGSGMSVSLGREAREAGLTSAAALTRFPGFGLASVSAGTCRSLKQSMERAPTVDDPHHALVNGAKPKPTKQALARSAVVLIAPEPPPAPRSDSTAQDPASPPP